MTKILSIGEALFDYFPTHKVIGGAPLNFAVHAVQLGAQVSLLTRVGQDDLGDEIFDDLAMRGVDIQYIQWDLEKLTGKVKINLDAKNNNEPSYQIIEDVAWDYITYNQQLTIDFQDYDCLYFGTLAQRNNQSQQTIQQIVSQFQGFKILDLNLRKPMVNSSIIKQSIQLANALKLNLDEAKYLQENLNFDRNIQNWLEQYALQWIVLTQGQLGTIWIDRQGTINSDRIIINPEENADTVGAGDGVCAVVVTKYLAGLSPSMIVKQANQIGAYIASCQGATPHLPLNLLM